MAPGPALSGPPVCTRPTRPSQSCPRTYGWQGPEEAVTPHGVPRGMGVIAITMRPLPLTTTASTFPLAPPVHPPLRPPRRPGPMDGPWVRRWPQAMGRRRFVAARGGDPARWRSDGRCWVAVSPGGCTSRRRCWSLARSWSAPRSLRLSPGRRPRTAGCVGWVVRRQRPRWRGRAAALGSAGSRSVLLCVFFHGRYVGRN